MPGILATDGYKFPMAEAGFPLRRETFYYSHRKGGPHYLPFDVEDMIRTLLPRPLRGTGRAFDAAFLEGSGYRMGGAFWAAMDGEVTIKAIPKGTWFFDREPVFTVTGPSALVSWLEPLVLQLHYCIQLATLAKLGQLPNRMTVTCEEQRDIVLSILDSVGAKVQVTIDQEGYYNHVLTRVRELATIVEDPSRIFDVGMRAATCMAQHRIALAACKEAGVTGTSNVELARELELKPVGTMGHEHVQRYGADEPAFRAMRDRHPGPTSFLLDTFSTIHSGLPTAFSLIAEDSTRNDSVRFDSGDKESQFLIACSMARHAGIQPRFILEDGFTADMTRTFETLRVSQHLEPSNVLYGYGGYIVQAPGDTLTRDRVSAVWKITQSGPNPTMKFGDEPGSGKESIPGRPVLHRAYDGSRWFGVVAQEGEELDSVQLYDADPVNHRRLRFAPEEAMEIAKTQGPRPRYSPATKALVETLYAARERHFNPRRQPCLS